MYLNKKNCIPYTDMVICTNTRVSLEIDTHRGRLDFFINGNHFKDYVVKVPIDVYFGV
jgi:hypothetical protein